MADRGWWACPNDPPCPHGGLIHDIYDAEDLVPRCCAEGCDCGKDRERYLANLTEGDRACDDYEPEPGPNREPYDACMHCGRPRQEHVTTGDAHGA